MVYNHDIVGLYHVISMANGIINQPIILATVGGFLGRMWPLDSPHGLNPLKRTGGLGAREALNMSTTKNSPGLFNLGYHFSITICGKKPGYLVTLD